MRRKVNSCASAIPGPGFSALIIPALLAFSLSAGACLLTDVDCDSLDASCNPGVAVALAAQFVTPTTLSPDQVSGLQVWLAADSITGLTSGQAISTWPDSSGNGNQATQSTSGLEPVWIENALNGHPVVRFDGVDDRMRIADAAGYKASSVTMLLVAKDNGSTTIGIILAYPQEQTNHTNPFFRWVFSRHPNNSGSISIRIGTQFAQSTQNTEWNNYAIYTYRTLPRIIHINGSLFYALGSEAITYPNAAGLILGTNAAGLEPFSGDVAEVILYSGVLPDSDRSRVECWLSAKYGITVPHSC